MRFRTARITALIFATVFAGLLLGCSTHATPDLLPHIITAPDTDPYRPIVERTQVYVSADYNSDDRNAYRKCVDELYSVVVYDNKCPVFQSDGAIKNIYDSALTVLDTIVLNVWHFSEDGEYNIVHAIHDYLVYSVNYDFALYDRYKAGEEALADHAAFHIDGVFTDGVAVCDGLSKAFAFLCAIEGVECIRVTGSLSGVPHAWNKVKINGTWYNIDVTADAANYTVGAKTYKQLSHGYFLLSDKTISEFRPQTHVFSEQPYTAEIDYDFYADESVDIDGKTFSLEITSKNELDLMFAAIKRDRNIGKIEIKLAYPEKVQVNSADMYGGDIMAAYGTLGNTAFASGDNKPYFRYPNGVYLILIRN